MTSIKYIIIVTILFGCQSRNTNSSVKYRSVSSDTVVSQIRQETISEPQNNFEIKDASRLTKDEMNTLEQESKIGNMIIVEIGSKMNIMSDGVLTYFLLGQDLSDYGIQNRFKHIFNIDHQEISTELFSSPQKINKFVFKQSILKIYFNNESNQFSIVSGRIENEEIFMPLNIYIGISKKNFFEKIFNNANQYKFSIVDTLSNGNEVGDIQQDYIFKNDTLKEVILKSDYDWIPFDL